jgi:hypothetical protein
MRENMEQRLHDHFRIQFEARVTNLSSREHSACGRVSEISESGISVDLPLQLTPGDEVQLEMADSVLSGHVVYSNPESSLFRTGIAVEQVRLGVTDLSRLLQRTLIEAMPGTPGVEPSDTYLD